MKLSNIALLAVAGISTVAIAQTAPQTTQANNAVANTTTAPAPGDTPTTALPDSEVANDTSTTVEDAIDPTVAGNETAAPPK